MPIIKTVALPTRFDYSVHQVFYQQCYELSQETGVDEIILDFGLVENMDSSAIGMLVIMHKKMGLLGKKLKINRARGTVRDVLMLANIEKIIEVTPLT